MRKKNKEAQKLGKLSVKKRKAKVGTAEFKKQMKKASLVARANRLEMKSIKGICEQCFEYKVLYPVERLDKSRRRVVEVSAWICKLCGAYLFGNKQ